MCRDPIKAHGAAMGLPTSSPKVSTQVEKQHIPRCRGRNSDFLLLCLLRFFAAMNVYLVAAEGRAGRHRVFALAFGP